MTPAASITFFRPEFDNFLQAPVGADDRGVPLSVLSALARLNIDPWAEAASLARMSSSNAKLRIARLIEELPGYKWSPSDCKVIAERLIKLLPTSVSLAETGKAKTATEAWQSLGLTRNSVIIGISVAFILSLMISSGFPPARQKATQDADNGSTSAQQTRPPRAE